jgi:O-antigen/teichoic acid export membrane protein
VVRRCLPTGIVMMLISLNANLPVYFVGHMLGIEQAGFYSSIAYFVTIGGLAATAATQVLARRLAVDFRQDRRQFLMDLQRLLWLSAAVAITGVALAAAFGRVFLLAVYGPAFGDKVEVLVWIALATGLSIPVAILGLGLTIARRFGSEIILTLASMLVVTACAWWLIPAMGISGAAAALAAGFAARLLLSGVVLLQHLRSGGQCAT